MHYANLNLIIAIFKTTAKTYRYQAKLCTLNFKTDSVEYWHRAILKLVLLLCNMANIVNSSVF